MVYSVQGTAPPTGQIRTGSLHGELLDALRELVNHGDLAPGIRVPERDLCERFAISRTPLPRLAFVSALLPRRQAAFTIEAVRLLLDELPEEQAEALAFRMILGWSLMEIAEATQTPLNTVRSRLRLAKDGVRKRVAEHEELAEALDEATGES